MGTASSHCGCHSFIGPFLELRFHLCWVPVGPKHKWLSWVKCFKACVIVWYCGWKQKGLCWVLLDSKKTLARFQSTFVNSLVGICCDFVLYVLSLAQREIDFEFLVDLRLFCSCVLSLSNVDLFRMLCRCCDTNILWVRFQNVSSIVETHLCNLFLVWDLNKNIRAIWQNCVSCPLAKQHRPLAELCCPLGKTTPSFRREAFTPLPKRGTFEIDLSLECKCAKTAWGTELRRDGLQFNFRCCQSEF